MKRIMKISLILLIMFTSTFSFSNNTLSGKNDTKVTYVTFENVKIGSILILKNQSGFIMYSETVKSSGKFSKQFDFTLLPAGEYTFEMESGFEVKIKALTISKSNVYFHPERQSSFFKPVVKLRSNKLLISQLALNKEPLEVKLYYTKKGNSEVMLYSGEFTGDNQFIIEKILSLSNNYKGDYRIVMSTNDHVYIENLKL